MNVSIPKLVAVLLAKLSKYLRCVRKDLFILSYINFQFMNVYCFFDCNLLLEFWPCQVSLSP